MTEDVNGEMCGNMHESEVKRQVAMVETGDMEMYILDSKHGVKLDIAKQIHKFQQLK